MRSFKIAGVLFAVLLVVSAVAYTSAVAAPEDLGTLPTSITGTAGENELKDSASGLVFKCKKAKVSGKVLSATTSEAAIDFEPCKIGGFAAESLGDKSGVILGLVPGHNCYLNKANHEAGELFTLPPGGIHVEVPVIGELLVMTGSVVGRMTPTNTSSSSRGMALDSRLKCEGSTGNEDVLSLEKEHNGEPLTAEELMTESLTLGNALTLDA